jgi:glucose-1-phosphate cytidylyltransferase
MTNKTAIILCGGKGTRLGELGKKMPKTLVKIQKKPILWYILKSLKKNNFDHFILPVGFKGNQIRKYINNNIEFKNFNIDIINTGKNNSIAQRIYKIKKYIKSEDFLILNGDAIFYANLYEILKKHIRRKKDISFICCQAEADFGTIGVRNNNVVNFQRGLDFNSVNTVNKKFKSYVYSGMSIINVKVLAKKFRDYKNFEKDFYPKIINKFKSDFHTLKGFWYAMDNVKDLEILNKQNVHKKIFNKINNLVNKLNVK